MVMIKGSSVVYGVCGIGNGHTHRSLPIIEYLLEQGAKVGLFAYGQSLDILESYLGINPNIRIFPVDVPYLIGVPEGLDFKASAAREKQLGRSPSRNLEAMAGANDFLGAPRLVLSDYEPVSAQFAYAHDAPLLTVDQQSKFLLKDFDQPIGQYTCTDEQMRLRMFFPKAERRLVCSFFRYGSIHTGTKTLDNAIQWCGPILRESILRVPKSTNRRIGEHLVVYVSPQGGFGAEEVRKLSLELPERRFELFAPADNWIADPPHNLGVRRQGDPEFLPLLTEASGLISTAGHTLISEAMYLGLPTLAFPLPLYEQQLNAAVIAENGFGMASDRLTSDVVGTFLSRTSTMRTAILEDKNILMRQDGCADVIKVLESILNH
jgi:uncharacterized protein (TIGR00661 family)